MRAHAAAILASVLALSGCGAGPASTERTLTVLAAASLATAFTELADEFEDEHAGVDVRLSFGGSSSLAAQIAEGAPADVFAAADERTMSLVADVGVARAEAVVFATNTVQVAARRDGPVKSLQDLVGPGVKVVLCAPQVPCGAAAREALDTAGIEVEPVSEEQSVADVLGKVASGEADAGVVYRTDVLAAGDRVTGLELPGPARVVTRCPVVALDGPADEALAAEFVAFVSGREARATLDAAGFGTP
ncbi:molybdate-binding protein [Aeromicrobium flavum]|uniref:Molybdate-binding protein n=1 Tax=Aeromicrobium flavum TaxID=416568 RepID=A0A512HWR9_9ACTN|nr:molybdate ABC transporter substrate-binding protein [Aeromicrobium flavum]GEO89893.1 molybdate-binding protein [Aeromicrobium flavum]